MSEKITSWQQEIITNYSKVYDVLMKLDDNVLEIIVEMANDYLEWRKECSNSKIAKTEEQSLVKGSLYLDGEIEL